MTSGANTTNTIGRFFAALDGREYSPAFHGVSRTCKYDFKDAGMWRVSLGEDGRLKTARGDGPADCIVTSPENLFLGVMSGSRSAFACYLRNEIQITGDAATAQVFSRFMLPDAAQPATHAARRHKKENGSE